MPLRQQRDRAASRLPCRPDVRLERYRQRRGVQIMSANIEVEPVLGLRHRRGGRFGTTVLLQGVTGGPTHALARRRQQKLKRCVRLEHRAIRLVLSRPDGVCRPQAIGMSRKLIRSYRPRSKVEHRSGAKPTFRARARKASRP